MVTPTVTEIPRIDVLDYYLQADRRRQQVRYDAEVEHAATRSRVAQSLALIPERQSVDAVGGRP